jgi:hypothetical protein
MKMPEAGRTSGAAALMIAPPLLPVIGSRQAVRP